MPRGSSRRSGGGLSSASGGSSGGLFGRSSSSTRSAPPPTQRAAAPPAPTQGGGGGGFLSNMASNVAGGMASGVGFGVAQRALDSVMGPRQMEMVHTNQQPSLESSSVQATPSLPSLNNEPVGRSCNMELQELNACLTQHSDINFCQHYFDSLKACRENVL